jgi:hypothetical protein
LDFSLPPAFFSLSTTKITKNLFFYPKFPEKKLFASNLFSAVLRIRIRIRMNPYGFSLLDPHPESAFQMRIPDADADPG